MRIKSEMADFLKNNIQSQLNTCEVYLFGSRTNDFLKGGDIDVLVLGERKLNWSEKGKIKNMFYQKFGEQKLDIVSYDFIDTDSFKNIALSTAIKL